MKASLTIRPVAEGSRFLGRDESAAERELLPARAAACEQCGVGRHYLSFIICGVDYFPWFFADLVAAKVCGLKASARAERGQLSLPRTDTHPRCWV
jgi:hypothetical protein